MKQTLATLFLFISLLITGCSSGDTTVEHQQVTYGQQLIDLKSAYDKNLITEREYNKARNAIVDKMKE